MACSSTNDAGALWVPIAKLSPFYKDTRVVILSEARASARSEEPAVLACANVT